MALERLYDYRSMLKKQEEELNDMRLKTGYPIVQIYGQRKTRFFPFCPPPPKGCEVFIGHIPKEYFEDILIPLFQKAGVIYEFRLLVEFHGANKGYAYATYTNKEDARKAIALFDKYEIRPGRKLGVLKSRDISTLKIEGLPQSKSEADIYEELSRFTPGIIDVTVCTDFTNSFKRNGCAYLEYESHYAASIARKILIQLQAKPFDCEMSFDWLSSKLLDEEADDKIELVRALFVRNLPLNVSESTLKSLFSCQGSLTVVQVKRVKDIAFVHFLTREDAQNSLNALHGFNLNGYSIEVFWARPTEILKEKLKMKYQVRSLSDLDTSPRRMANSCSEKNLFGYCPPQILSNICQTNGWGEPLYHIVHTSSSADEPEAFYRAKVLIPNLPCPNKHFEFSAFFLSCKEAKYCVAEHALRSIIPLQNCPAQSSISQPLPCIMADPVPKIDLSNNCSWNPLHDRQALPTNQFLDQDPYLSLMASAASLASVELQLKTKPNSRLLTEWT